MDDYPVPAGIQRTELEIKRSRFITTVAQVENRADTRDLIDRCKIEFPGANHHCWACIAGTPDDASLYNQSDAGEPRGSAGKPMLNVLSHSGLGNIGVVVSRYFGGIKLGTGGLARAYTQSVSEALHNLQTRQRQITEALNIGFHYSLQGKIDYYLVSENIRIGSKNFDNEVAYSLRVPASRLEIIKAKLLDLAQGQIEFSG